MGHLQRLLSVRLSRFLFPRMLSFFQNKHTGLILLVGGSLAVLALGWQLGGGGHAAAAANTTSLLKPAQHQPKETGHAPLSWTAPAAPLEMSYSDAAPLTQAPQHMATQELSKPAANPRKDAEVTADQIIPVDPAQPANWMPAGAQHVSVQGFVPATGGRGAALDVIITPAASGNYATAQSGSQTTTAGTTNATQPRATTGLTYEEQLFRTRWGWAAYGAAQRAAQWQQ